MAHAVRDPTAATCAWNGKTEMIGSGRYQQVTDADWEKTIGRDPLLTLEWAVPDLNRGPQHFQCCALPTELTARCGRRGDPRVAKGTAGWNARQDADRP